MVGSSTRRATGVRSRRLCGGSLRVSGVVSQVLVKTASVWSRPRFPARCAIASALAPAVLFTTRSGCARSFSPSIISTSARANMSEPPPRALWTTSSTGRPGTKPWACTRLDAQSVSRKTIRFVEALLLIGEPQQVRFNFDALLVLFGLRQKEFHPRRLELAFEAFPERAMAIRPG